MEGAMDELLGTALMREMRQQDPKRWLDWSLTALLERLAKEEGPRAVELLREGEHMRHEVASWPADLYPPAEVERMMERIEAIGAELDGTLAPRELTSDVRELLGAAEHSRPQRNLAREPRREPLEDREDRPTPVSLLAEAPASSETADRRDSAPPTPVSQVTLSDRIAPSEHPSYAPLDDPGQELQLIERPDTPDERLVMLSHPEGQRAEAYRALYYRLDALASARSFLVTSPGPGQGASSCAANLALAMAEGANAPVLLVEARFARPTHASMFGFEPTKCFSRRLAHHRRRSREPWPTAELDGTNLHILAADAKARSRAALDPRALAEVVDIFVRRYAYVVIDGPPTTDDSDARFIAPALDGVVMTILSGITRERQIKRALELLAPVTPVGYLLLGG
jgi:Mrp family chromosome partitioning ATPase